MRYEIYDKADGELLATGMTLESAIIFLKGFYEEYNEEAITLEISSYMQAETDKEGVG